MADVASLSADRGWRRLPAAGQLRLSRPPLSPKLASADRITDHLGDAPTCYRQSEAPAAAKPEIAPQLEY
jgi:hypothetical protein